MTARERMIARIKQIREYEQDFDRRTMRWDHVFIADIHISEVDFNELADDQLVAAFETIIRRHYTQM